MNDLQNRRALTFSAFRGLMIMKKQSFQRSRVCAGSPSRVFVAAVLFLMGGLSANAQSKDLAWWMAGDGVFETPANWDTGAVPGPKLTAVFAPEGEITVNLASDAMLGGLDNQGTAMGDDAASLILDLAGHSLAIGAEENTAPAIALGAHLKSGPRKLTFRNGRVTCRDVVVNNPLNPESSLIVVGEGAELDAPATVGNNEKGELHVESGGRWISRSLAIYIGRVGLSSEGRVKITGKDSNWQALGQAEGTHCMVGVGASGTGSLEILEGGKMMAYVVQLAGHQTHLETPAGEGRGRVVVNGSGSEMECAYLYVGGGVNRAVDTDAVVGGAGTVEIADGAKVACGLFRVFSHSTLTFRGGSLEQTGHFRETAISDPSVLEPSSVLHFVLNKSGGAAPLSTANLKIDGALLDIELAEGFAPSPGQEFPLISASGSLEVNFAKIKNGDKIQAGGHTFAIDFGPQGTGPILLKAVQK